MAAPLTLREILDTWQAAEGDAARLARLDRLALARGALAIGHPNLASEILREPATRADASPEMRYLAGLAEARIGALLRAQQFADGLLSDATAGAFHVDALALAGRIAKDRWARLPPGARRDEAGRQAIDCYRRAWEHSRDAFPGINAATMLQLMGHTEDARALARDARAAALKSIATAEHWRQAILGEAALLLGEDDLAAAHYHGAVAAARQEVGHIASMRRQVRLLASTMPIPEVVRSALEVPRVVVFTGHMLDAPGRSTSRFPAAIEPSVAAAITNRVAAMGTGFGYCAAACGSDLLFIEALLARNAEVHITLPFDRDDFIATSVAFAGPAWVTRFERALAQAASVTYGVRERYLGDESLFAYAGALMQGAAVLRARELESEPLLLAVVDDASERRSGGSVDLLASWQALGLRAECIDICALRSVAPVLTPASEHRQSDQPHSDQPQLGPARAAELRANPLRREVRTMLFADMVGYSRLAEEDTPSFLAHFLGAIADIVAQAEAPPEFVNTWGDGLFMVFNDVAVGARFALQLRDAVAQCDWSARGLPPGTNIRIGMHTGPVFRAFDRLIARQNYFGSHVIRAARIEPVVAPGAIYVSAELAFILAARGSPDFATDYLGTVPLAKGHGAGILYRLRNGGDAE
jgi:class 3 adenylate cyclase